MYPLMGSVDYYQLRVTGLASVRDRGLSSGRRTVIYAHNRAISLVAEQRSPKPLAEVRFLDRPHCFLCNIIRGSNPQRPARNYLEYMEETTQIPNPENTYQSLKERLLSGVVSLEDVRKTLLALDQSTPSRDAAEGNLKFLYDPEMVEYVEKKSENTEAYYRFLSLTEFHVAQKFALKEPAESLSYFKKSLESAKKDSSQEVWIAYVQGTILYMEGKEIPESIIDAAKDQRNMEILRNFNTGLKARGTPLYKEDYSK